MNKILILLDNFLTSGHTFSKDEYEIKSKFILLNGISGLIILFFLPLLIYLFYINKLVFMLAAIFCIVVILLMLILRKFEKFYKFVVLSILILSTLITLVAISMFPQEQVRILWFMIVLMLAYFLGGKKIGLFFTSLSVISLIFSYLVLHIHLNLYLIFLVSIIFVLASTILNFYEYRQAIATKRLYDINTNLEKKVEDEVAKKLVMYANLTEKLKDKNEEFEELAHYDTLTHLPNRALFYDRVKHGILKSSRNNKKMAILFLDLDNFKEINDSFGHHSGDEVLKKISTRLSGLIRSSDTLARLGGDEFTILLDDFSDISNIGELAQKYLNVLSSPFRIKGEELCIFGSIGVSIYPNDGQDVDTLLKNADTAMYSAKKSGQHTVHFYTEEMTKKSMERLLLENKLRKALENNEFVVYYQPVIDSIQKRIVGLEALVRWNHPEKGIVSPAYFLEVAESTGIIIELGNYVLEEVTTQCIQWHDKGFNPEFIAVNLSVKQLRDKNLLARIVENLEKVDFRKHWLELEITESYMMSNQKEAIELLKTIKNLGVSLSIDDFGTGYSSLSYLRKLPINKLKIDKSFIDDIDKSAEDRALVSAIVMMAKSLHLEVVSEGVERQEQKDFLDTLGCHKIQGYFYAKPMPIEVFEKKYKLT